MTTTRELADSLRDAMAARAAYLSQVTKYTRRMKDLAATQAKTAELRDELWEAALARGVSLRSIGRYGIKPATTLDQLCVKVAEAEKLSDTS